MEKTDSFAALVARLGRWIFLVGAVSWVYVAIRWGWKGAAGFAFGVIGAYLNMRWLAGGLVEPKGRAAVLFMFRIALVGGAAYVILESLEINPLFLLAGLLSATVAVVLEILFQLFYART
ncbi:MAG: ATP synthase subunit I [Bryobacteraceae bacterium]